MSRQPGIFITLHAGAVRPQPWLSEADTSARWSLPLRATIASRSRAACAIPRGDPSDTSIPATRIGPVVSSSGIRRMSPGIDSNRIGGAGPPSAATAASFQSGEVIRIRFGSTPIRIGCSSPSRSSTPGSSVMRSPALRGLPSCPSRAPSNVRWSVMYAASNPEPECHSRLWAASKPLRPSWDADVWL